MTRRVEAQVAFKLTLDNSAFYSEVPDPECANREVGNVQVVYDPTERTVYLSFECPTEELNMTPEEAETLGKSLLLAVEHADRMRGGQ